jgi:molecular chaperone HtpG
MATHKFKTEVSELLKLIIHSLYSHKEIFLRELISNSSDALDKLKYLTLTDDAYKKVSFDPRIDISFDDREKKTLTISDTGIGMNEEELASNLGTIARSGTRNFLEKMSGDSRKDVNLIGQFGVGFYSAFMVADRVDVISRKAGEDAAWKWSSDGKGGYEVTPAEREGFGTTVVLHLNDEGREYANRWQIESVVKKYSNHIPFPIFIHYDQVTHEGEKESRKEKRERKVEQVNSASALWRKPKSELSPEDYTEFYKTLTGDSDEPLFHLHVKAEGTQEYVTLFYVPKHAPFDLYHADYRPGVKLYVKRVFITDDAKELLPVYLRFVRGIIDSEDLPLNVRREILQQNRILRSITVASTKKLLSEFKTIAENNPEMYAAFSAEFNRPLKEGLYSDFENRDALLELVRFKSTAVEGFTSLAAYVERMKEGQKGIYYITGSKEENLRNSPLLESYRARGYEVLVMDDEIDEIVVPTIGKYKDKELKAVNKSSTAEDLKEGGSDEKRKDEDLKPLLSKIKLVLGEKVKDVRTSNSLKESPSCIVSDADDPTLQLQQMLKALGQKDVPPFIPILEINPDHEIVRKMRETSDQELVEDASNLLLDQALLAEGGVVEKPAEFVKRLNRVLNRAL